MSDWLDIDRLQLSHHKPPEYVPKPSATLLDRVRDFGLVEPVVVRPIGQGRYEILANAEAWVAAGRAGLHKIPVNVREDLDEEEARDIVVEHYGVQARSVLDDARYFEEQLAFFGGSKRRGAITKLAVASGRSRPYIAHSLRLLALPHEIQNWVQAGRLSAGQVRPLVAIADRATQLRLARSIMTKRLTAREAEALARATRAGEAKLAPEKPPNKRGKDADTKRFEQRVSDTIGAEFRLENGRAIIDYCNDLDVLQGIVERMGYRGA